MCEAKIICRKAVELPCISASIISLVSMCFIAGVLASFYSEHLAQQNMLKAEEDLSGSW